MTSLRPRTLAVGLILCLGTAPLSAVAQTGTDMPQVAAPQIDSPGVVEPDSVAALKRMSAYLMSLNTAGITSEGSLDVVTDDGQRIQLDGVTTYKIRKPNGFVIDYVSDAKSRRFIYDGKQFTVYSPKLDFYATVPAPATNREVLDTLYNRFGIALPLEDLFRWNDPNGLRADKLKSGFQAGTATLDGVPTDHYAFREDDVDWEIWIEKGDRPVPRKVVIVDRTDPNRPTFIARLKWTVNPTFSDRDFAFVPDKDAKRIEQATFEQSGE
jgi:hypothetical protein